MAKYRTKVGDFWIGKAGNTHPAGVDLLTTEGIVVGTHVGGGDAVPGVLVVRSRCRDAQVQIAPAIVVLG